MSENLTPLPPTEHDRKPGQIDESRRRFGKAGLGSSAVLLTLASRPVLGATCLTPSMAGSGNHSQHQGTSCQGMQTVQHWIDATTWPGGFTKDQTFHPLFTHGPYLNFTYIVNPGGAISMVGSYTLLQVLQGNTPSAVDPAGIGKFFVAALLSAANGDFGSSLQPVGPDPSVRGIEDEYARNGKFIPHASHPGWNALTIASYFQDPWSVF